MQGDGAESPECAITMTKRYMGGRIRITYNQIGIAIAVQIAAGDFNCAHADGNIIGRPEAAITIVEKDGDVFVGEVGGHDVVEAVVIKILHRSGIHTFATWIGSRREKKASSACPGTPGNHDHTYQENDESER